MLKTRSSDRRQVKTTTTTTVAATAVLATPAEVKGIKPHSIVKRSVADGVTATATVATKTVLAKKHPKQIVETVAAKNSISTQRIVNNGIAMKSKRVEMSPPPPAKVKRPNHNAKTVALTETETVKLPTNAASTIKVEADAKVLSENIFVVIFLVRDGQLFGFRFDYSQ